MGQVTRDYIPEGDSLTPAEAQRVKRNAIIRTGAVHQDFTPDPSDPTRPPAHRTQAEMADIAMQAALARAEHASRRAYDTAVLRLRDWTASAAVNAMEGMALHELQVYLLAEERHSARVDILDAFPPIDPAIRERYPDTGVNAAEDLEAQADAAAAVAAAKEAREQLDVHVEAKEEDAPEVFYCLDCDKPFKNAAGLKGHNAAKHAPQAEA